MPGLTNCEFPSCCWSMYLSFYIPPSFRFLKIQRRTTGCKQSMTTKQYSLLRNWLQTDPCNYAMHAKWHQVLMQRQNRSIQLRNACQTTASPHAEAQQIHTTTQCMRNDSKSSSRGTTDPYNYAMHAKCHQVFMQRHNRSIQLRNACQTTANPHAEAKQSCACHPMSKQRVDLSETSVWATYIDNEAMLGAVCMHLLSNASSWSKRHVRLGHIDNEAMLCAVCAII